MFLVLFWTFSRVSGPILDLFTWCSESILDLFKCVLWSIFTFSYGCFWFYFEQVYGLKFGPFHAFFVQILDLFNTCFTSSCLNLSLHDLCSPYASRLWSYFGPFHLRFLVLFEYFHACGSCPILDLFMRCSGPILDLFARISVWTFSQVFVWFKFRTFTCVFHKLLFGPSLIFYCSNFGPLHAYV